MFDIVKANLLSSENIYHRCYGLLRTTVGEANEPECSVEWYHVPVPEHMPPLCKGNARRRVSEANRRQAALGPEMWCSAQRIKNLHDCRGQSYHNSWVGGIGQQAVVLNRPMRIRTRLIVSVCTSSPWLFNRRTTCCPIPQSASLTAPFTQGSLWRILLDCTNSPESIPSGEVVPRGRLRASPTVGTGNCAGSPNRFFHPRLYPAGILRQIAP